MTHHETYSKVFTARFLPLPFPDGMGKNKKVAIQREQMSSPILPSVSDFAIKQIRRAILADNSADNTFVAYVERISLACCR